MPPVLIAILVGLTILTLWGAVSPRGQWRTLMGWSRSASAPEPRPGVFGIQRLVAVAGLIAIVLVGVSSGGTRPAQPTPGGTGHPTSEVQRVWGRPEPQVVNRVFAPLASAPFGLVDQPVLRYLGIDGAQRNPDYLFSLNNFSPPSDDGYLGTNPEVGLTALDTADLVVEVRADRRCIPQAVAVVEADKTVSVGVFYGQPNPGGLTTAQVMDCSTSAAGADSVSVLIPVDLQGPLQGRAVVTLGGAPIPKAGATR
ncbi:MAG TPA: hypothetical protein VGC18_09890 [Lacisediminihabitans sp.]|uniref:hypothetical protein n=1 Tax=Lacisediminihabitans sp. TaxID=2787631 RepID=UPI002ED8455A